MTCETTARRALFAALTLTTLARAAPAQRTAPSGRPAAPTLVGVPSPDSENPNGQVDPKPPPRPRSRSTLAGIQGGGPGTHLKDHPAGRDILDQIAQAIIAREVSVAPIWGTKYMVHDCLGLKASAGSFLLRLRSPNARFEGTGAVLTFVVDRVAIDVLTLRMRPNPNNPANPCTFGGRFEVGGSASDVRYEYRFDPILDLQQCKVGRVVEVDTRWSIGGLNLKPLQNNLDYVARKMIEEGLNYSTNYLDQVIATANLVLQVRCHG